MNAVTSLKIIVFPSLEGKNFAEKRGFCAASSNLLKPTKQGTQLEEQKRSGECREMGKLADRRNLRNKKQFSCPTIIDFNSLKSFQEIRPIHKPKRIFNGFFPSRVRSAMTGLPNTYKEETFEELVPNPNISPYQDGAVLSRTATSTNSFRSEPITLPNEHEPWRIKPGLRRTMYSLRNGSSSPWIDRYKLKQKNISTNASVELKNKTGGLEDPPVRGFSR